MKLGGKKQGIKARQETQAEGVYLQGLHGEVRWVVVVDLAGVPGSFFMEIVSCLKIQTACD